MQTGLSNECTVHTCKPLRGKRDQSRVVNKVFKRLSNLLIRISHEYPRINVKHIQYVHVCK